MSAKKARPRAAGPARLPAPGHRGARRPRETRLAPRPRPRCRAPLPPAAKANYLLVATNVGAAPTSGPITITDTLPVGPHPDSCHRSNAEAQPLASD